MSVSMTHHASPVKNLPLIAPLVGALTSGTNQVFALLAVALVVLALAVKIWGLVALTMVALAMVPLMFIFFFTISWPF